MTQPKNPESIHERLAFLRNRKGLAQAELARLLGITYQAIQSWERGDSAPKRARLEKVAHFFDVPLSYLISGEIESGHTKPINKSTSLKSAKWHDRIRARMTELELTQADLAKRINSTPSRLGNYIQGTREPSLSMLTSIASALCVSTDWILVGEGTPPLPIRKLFAKNLLTLMRSNPNGMISQNKLAQMSGVAQSTIGRILREEIDTSIDVVQSLAQALNVESWELLHPGHK
jgi:transcriptional regulator with XRE-family HTH domain